VTLRRAEKPGDGVSRRPRSPGSPCYGHRAMRQGRRSALAMVLASALSSVASADGPVVHGSSHVSRPTIPSGYFYSVRYLHTPTPGRKAPVDIAGRPELVLRSVNLNESEAFMAADDTGGFASTDLPRAQHVLRESSTGHEFPVEPRVLDVLYLIQRHFNAQEIRVISAYRTPVEGNGQGNHGRGRAVDFVVPGADDQDVARFARGLGFVGVGLYPIGSFVHVDVRPQSYFWIDRSGPGHTSRERGVLPEIAAASDAAARERGEGPPNLVPGENAAALDEE
jgi:uncharacterized protein YcbK (DUF882 family)